MEAAVVDADVAEAFSDEASEDSSVLSEADVDADVVVDLLLELLSSSLPHEAKAQVIRAQLIRIAVSFFIIILLLGFGVKK